MNGDPITVDAVFQSTHSRGVRQDAIAARKAAEIISIHALTRSATGRLPTGGCREMDFNPRTHEECDSVRDDVQYLIRISIHALTRSATLNPISLPSVKVNFNPRTHEECDIFGLVWTA